MNEPPVQCFTCGGPLIPGGACPNPKCAGGGDLFDSLAKSIEDRAAGEGLTLKEAKRAFAKEFSGCRKKKHKGGVALGPRRQKRKRRRRRPANKCSQKGVTGNPR